MSPVSENDWQEDIPRWFADRMHAVVPGPAPLEAPAGLSSPSPMPSPARDAYRGTNVPFSLPLLDSSSPLQSPTVRPSNEWKTIEEKSRAEARRQQIPSLLEDGHFLASRTMTAQDIRKIRNCLHRPQQPRRLEGTSYRKISGEKHEGVLECEVAVEGKCLGWFFSGKYCGECDAYMCRPCYDSINVRHARWQTDERREVKAEKFRAKFCQ